MVLIVEDEVLVALTLQVALERAGHQVVGPAFSAGEALQLAEAEQPDPALVNLDLRSEIDGIAVARLLRERYAFTGELRAIGDIQRDQLFYLREVGFDALAVRDDKDVIDALFGLHDFADGYQNSAVRTPWFRRRAAQAPPGDAWFPGA